MSKLSLFFGLFFLGFGPRIYDIIDTVSLVSVVLILLEMVRRPNCNEIRVIRSHLNHWCALLFFYALFNFGINEPRETFLITRFLRTILQVQGAVSLFALYCGTYGNGYLRALLLHTIYATALHAIIMVAMFTSETVRETIWAITTPEFQRAKRVGGLTGALDSQSAVQAYGLLLAFVLKRTLNLTFAIQVCLIVLLSLSIIVSGRTGLILLACVLPFWFIEGPRNILPKLVTLLAVAGSALAISVALETTARNSDFGDRVEHQQHRLSQLFEPDNENNDAIGKLMIDYSHPLPSDSIALLFGNALSGRSDEYRLPVDVGWILDIYTMGVCGLLIASWLYWRLFVESLRLFSTNKEIALLGFANVVFALAVNSKVLFLLARVGLFFTVMILLSVHVTLIQMRSSRLAT